jgi:hypothetical protein
VRILNEMRIMGQNAHFSGSDHERMNRFVAWYSKKLLTSADAEPAGEVSENRVALSLDAYISLCKSCKTCSYACWGDGLRVIPEISKLHSPRQTQNFGGYGYG